MQTINETNLLHAICKKSFFEFFKAFWEVLSGDELILNWHIEYLCDELQALAELVFAGEPKEYDLIINISPASTKSTIISQAFPAWCWTRMPHFRCINASYAATLAHRDSVRCRDIVESEQFRLWFPGLELRDDENMKGLFTNKHKGGRLSAGVMGRVTGFHGDILIVDDPINPEKSYSEVELKKINRWMETTLSSRGTKRSDTPMILVMQRLNQGDPTGSMLEKGGKIRHICLPAELQWKEDKLAKKKAHNISPPELLEVYEASDGLMDPRRLSRRVLKELEKKLGAYGYASQYLQDPVPLGGGMFKTDMITIHDEAPAMVRLVRSWDKAGTPGDGAYSCGVLMGVDKLGQYWILDVVRGQWGAAERERIIRQTAELDAKGKEFRISGTPHGTEMMVEIIAEQEGGSGGKESGENTIRNLKGFYIVTYHPTGTKEARAYGFASQMGLSGQVHILNRDWTKPWIDEHRMFPHGKYKDQVDASSSGFTRLARTPRPAGAIKAFTANSR